MRDLTSDEAKKVDAQAKQERPYYYSSDSAELVQISSDFEAWLILTPMGIRARLATFFQFILDNDINDWPQRKNLLDKWLEDEEDDLRTEIEGYGLTIDSYDEIRESLASSTAGFEDVDEVNRLAVDLTTSTGDLVERRDNLKFEKALSVVLQSRAEGSGIPDDVEQEIKSWVRLLLTYE